MGHQRHQSDLRKIPHHGQNIAVVGYGDAQVRELEQAINATSVDLVVIDTPIILIRILKIEKPTQRVRYELQIIGQPTLADILRERFG